MSEMCPEVTSISSFEEAQSFLKKYCNFSKGLYTLQMIARPKENDHLSCGERICHTEILTNETELMRKTRLLKSINSGYVDDAGVNPNYRLYVSTNPIDAWVSAFELQKELTELFRSGFRSTDSSNTKAAHINRIWRSTMTNPECLNGKKHLIDIDKKDREYIEEAVDLLINSAEVYHCIESPNGYHLVTSGTDKTKFHGVDNIEHKGKTNNLFITEL